MSSKMFPKLPNPFEAPTGRPERAEILPTPSKMDGRETAKRALDAILKLLLLKNAQKLNEGTKAVIFTVDFSPAPPEVLEALQEEGVEVRGKQVLKVLKFGYAEDVSREFEMQRKAHEILRRLDPQVHAHVPRPIAYRTLPADAVLQERLAAAGVPAGRPEIDVLIMDKVEGKDLATLMYEAVVKKHPRSVHLAHMADRLTFEQLEQEVAQALGFRVPGRKGKTEEERRMEEALVERGNRELVYAYLKRVGFRIHPAVEEQVRRSMEALHAEGVLHGDAHHRNIMVSGDPEGRSGEAPRTYLVDFGTASEFAGAYSADALVKERGERDQVLYLDDFTVPNDLKANFLRPPGDERAEERKKAIASWRRTYEKYKKMSRWDAWRASVETLPASKNPLALYFSAPNDKANMVGCLVLEAVEQGRIPRSHAIQLLEGMRSGLGSLAEQRVADAFLEELGDKKTAA